MIYEERRYTVAPGKLSAVLRRFEEHTFRFFTKHGMRLVGFWTPVIGPSSNEVCYLLAFEDLAAREKAWGAMSADTEWRAIRTETEKEGPLVLDISSRILEPAQFAPQP
jgi:hypothetical protein